MFTRSARFGELPPMNCVFFLAIAAVHSLHASYIDSLTSSFREYLRKQTEQKWTPNCQDREKEMTRLLIKRVIIIILVISGLSESTSMMSPGGNLVVRTAESFYSTKCHKAKPKSTIIIISLLPVCLNLRPNSPFLQHLPNEKHSCCPDVDDDASFHRIERLLPISSFRKIAERLKRF